mmetsp:Transcript_28512/g.47412  ORF Transcript_28512/g.47412 Transcript_28512/m.47412 type:complete len:239 (+) Transcript_28512:1028-1744(+)
MSNNSWRWPEEVEAETWIPAETAIAVEAERQQHKRHHRLLLEVPVALLLSWRECCNNSSSSSSCVNHLVAHLILEMAIPPLLISWHNCKASSNNNNQVILKGCYNNWLNSSSRSNSRHSPPWTSSLPSTNKHCSRLYNWCNSNSKSWPACSSNNSYKRPRYNSFFSSYREGHRGALLRCSFRHRSYSHRLLLRTLLLPLEINSPIHCNKSCSFCSNSSSKPLLQLRRHPVGNPNSSSN